MPHQTVYLWHVLNRTRTCSTFLTEKRLTHLTLTKGWKNQRRSRAGLQNKLCTAQR